MIDKNPVIVIKVFESKKDSDSNTHPLRTLGTAKDPLEFIEVCKGQNPNEYLGYSLGENVVDRHKALLALGAGYRNLDEELDIYAYTWRGTFL